MPKINPSWQRKLLDWVRKAFSISESAKQELRDRWGHEHKRYRNRTEITQLYQLMPLAQKRATVDDATWADLELDTLFDRLDSTITPIGQQYLYRQLRTVETEHAQLEQQYQTSQAFLNDKALRENVQFLLLALRSRNGATLTGMLFDEFPSGQFPKTLAWTLAGLSISSIILALFIPALIWLPAIPLLMNFVFSERYSEKIGRHSLSFSFLKKMLLVAKRLPTVTSTSNIEQIEYCRRMESELVELQSQFRIAGFDSTSTNVIVTQLAYFLNLFCLFDFLIFMRASERLEKHKEALIGIYNALASIDSAISVASYLISTTEHCNPRFTQDTNLRFDSVVHPLLDNAIPNDFQSVSASALITGSNMAGKSTFLKAIGVNLILAQTLWFCHARVAHIPRMQILSSIKHTDSLSAGKSTYFTQIEGLLRLVNASQSASGQNHLFLIDEILHGTNTVERIASSAAILDCLAKNGTVLVTSHDIELTDLLPDKFKSYHFRESADLNNMFDYKIHDGHCTTRNAITLLESIGFPADVISAARRNAELIPDA